ncbi:MAG: glycoside hydrolase family 78 protein [Lachnospiraceae bacterium]|nr:glycoside hydrolase family 78 protein [Lachnospiraceae bacterium]
MKLKELRVNHIETPMGFQVTPLSFSWKVTEAGEAKKQKWARIRIWQGGEIIFDSGEDEKADSLDYQVNLQLTPRTRYIWQVEVTADNGEVAEADSWFETGKKEEAWKAEWITSKLDADIPAVLRKRFILADGKESGQGSGEQSRQESRLYICGLGVYEVYLNGEKVGSEYLAPGYHSYDFHLQVQTYDVTEYLRDGENEMQIWLGDGWFRGRLGFDGGYTNLYGDRCYAIAELYAGEELVAVTDETWESKESPVVFSNIYDGEIYDASKEKALHDADGWKGVRAEAPEKCGALCDRYGLPIVKKESFTVAEVIRTPKNETVLDFGQELTGWVEFTCRLPKGVQIRLSASEIMQDGCFYRDNLRTAKAEFIYRSDGEKRTVRPHFTFYGFRYMKVEYLDEKGGLVDAGEGENVEAFTAYHLRSDFDQIGEIKTGNDKVNRLFLNALWGQKDNFLDVPTDCPQRDERLGWTGDAQVFSETACYNMFMPAFYRKYLWDMRAEQSILGGSVPNVVPRLKEGMVSEHGSCPWADAGVVIPWNVYLHYGSKTLLEECYPGMKAWVTCERAREEAVGGPHLIKEGFHFADWLALDNAEPGPFGATDPLYIASAYYYKGAKCVAEAAAVLEYTEDAESFGCLAEEILKAIQEKYFDEEGLCICHTQTGSALAIAFGLVPERAARGREGEALRARVEANDNHLNTGFVGTTILCPALTAAGNHETAVDLLLNEEFPGWLYCVNLGATTIWERWDSVLPDGHISPEGMNSLNHYSYGSIEAWMYKDVCGIRPAQAGYRRAVIEPHADARLQYAEGMLNTSAGLYKSSWRYGEDGKVTYQIEVPFHAEAEFVLDGKRQVLEAGRYTFVR